MNRSKRERLRFVRRVVAERRADRTLGVRRAPSEHSTMGAPGGRNAGDSPDRRESSGLLRT